MTRKIIIALLLGSLCSLFFGITYNENRWLQKAILTMDTFLQTYGINIFSKHRVIIGKNGWLFYAPDDSISDIQGKSKFSNHEIKAWKNYLSSRKHVLTSRGIDYRFIIGPEKYSIYKEQLPNDLASTNLSRMDTLRPQIASLQTFVIDPKQNLLKIKPSLKEPLYFKTDTHWNQVAGWHTYLQIIKSFPNMQPTNIYDTDHII